ncbi:MAG: hypothetical protein HOV87_27705 [Catenulispora sp.]|nr:hypothetical protein [Catenulispora sp.]
MSAVSTGEISGEPGSPERLTALLAAGDAPGIADFFHGMPEKDRRAFVKTLRAYQKSLTWEVFKDATAASDWPDYSELKRRSGRAQIPAAMAVLPSASAVARYVRTIDRESFLVTVPAAIRRVLTDRDPAWLPELADELSAVLDPFWQRDLVAAVAEAAGVFPAANPNFVRSWAMRYQWGREPEIDRQEFLADPRLAELLPLTFEGDRNDDLYNGGSTLGKHVVAAVAEGKIARAVVLDASLRRLLRGGRPGALQGQAAFFAGLAPTDEEIAERISSCISLLSAQQGTVVKVFLAAVIKANDAGHIAPELALEAASIAVTRSEKNIVKTTLGWLDALATAHPDRAGEIAGHLASAFGASGADLQQRAVKLIGKRAGVLGEADKQRLVAEAETHLPPDLAATLAKLLGVQQGSAIDDAVHPEAACAAAAYPDVAPYEPRPLLAPIGSPAELAEHLVALMGRPPAEAMVVERVLEAILVFSQTDLEELRVALEPVIHRMRSGSQWSLDDYPQTPRLGLYRLVENLTKLDDAGKWSPHRASVHQLWPRVRKQAKFHVSRRRTSPADFLILRMAELGFALGLPDLPPLLAVPTAANGRIDPEVLAARLRECEAQGWVPLEADFHQALLRLPRDCAGVDVSGFTSKEGRRFAEWVGGDRVALPALEMPVPMSASQAQSGEVRRVHMNQVSRQHVRHPATLFDLLPGVWIEPERQFDRSDWDVCWPAILPACPDLPAVALVGGGLDWTTAQPSPASAVVLAESDDPTHRGTHHVIAARLVDADAGMRAPGVDAALVLASRGLLQPMLLAAALEARLAAEGSALRRIVPGLRDLANGGAAGQSWETIAALLPRILPPALPKALGGTAELLAAGTELAAALKVRMPIAAVTAVAGKKGGSAVVDAAKRLATVLGEG